MPRTFSRGTKVTAQHLNRMQQYLSVAEGDIWIRRMRFLYCGEQSLIETDILPYLNTFLPTRIARLTNILDDLVGGGILPNAMKQIVTEIKLQNQVLQSKVERIKAPTDVKF